MDATARCECVFVDMMLFTEQNKCFLNILKQNKCRSSKQLLKEGILSEVDAEDRDERQ